MTFEDVEFPKFFWIASAFFIFCFIIILVECVCGCRKRIPKNELLGLAGMVKITNPDENVNFNSSPPNIQLNSIAITSDELIGDNHDASKRNSTMVSTATRSLPDLPVDSGEGVEKVWGPTETNTDTNSELYATVEDANRSKKRVLTRGLTAESTYTASQTDDSLSPYARLKGEHPYDQLHQSEHQYAQVGTNGAPVPSTSQDTTVNSTPSRRFEAERAESASKSASESEAVDDIPAASAIAGSVPANHDLPYMTPPLPTEHFSGDSQDSSKGYTSISVREPLARIMATARQRGDPHYATVSDDSDEMYAAIEERGTPGGEYTSGSETYAQIASQPPLAHTQAQHHTRQESSSSACSSVVNPGSPKREKRQANSPLPEPPQSPTIDEMYAKVVKKQRSVNSGVTTPESEEPPGATGTGGAASSSTGNVSTCRAGAGNRNEEGAECEPNYEELQPAVEPDYASLSRPHDSNYEKVKSSAPNYEKVKNSDKGEDPPGMGDPDYEKVKRGDSIEECDGEESDYEKVKEEPCSDYERVGEECPRQDPNYETVRESGGTGPDYETLRHNGKESSPNYETVREGDSDTPAPDYETLRNRSCRLESHSDDPNYESVGSEIGYEQLADEERDYETVLARNP